MRILVTGNRGYIGNILVPMLLERGHDVVGLDTDLYRRCTFAGSCADIATITSDLRDASEGQLQGFEAIAHLAGLSNDPLGDLNPRLTDEINCNATIRLAELAKRAGVRRFVFSSSCSTYGAAGDDFLDEESEFNPVTPYGKSKVDAETGLRALADKGFSPTFLRSATVYGLSPRIRFDLVLNNLTAWAYTTGKVLLKSDGTPWRPVVHIADISRAFVAVLEAPRDAVHLQAFNVGRTEENFRISELAVVVTEVVPGSHIEFAEGAGPDKRSYRVDCSKIRRMLPNFEPQWSVRRGVEELYQAFRATDLSPEAFEGAQFHRLAHLKLLMSQNVIGDDLRHMDTRTGGSSVDA